MMSGRWTGKCAFFLPNLIVEENVVQYGTSVIVTRTDVDAGYRPQAPGPETVANHYLSVNMTMSVFLFGIREISASPSSGH